MKTTIVIDARDHILGRLSAVVAKELLNGQHIAVTHCEDIAVAGDFFRTRAHYLDQLQKRTNFNHKRGPFHFRDPAQVLKSTVKRMTPSKTARGKAALARLEVYSGVPAKYQAGHVVVPEAMREFRLKSTSRYSKLGDVMKTLGWHNAEQCKLFEEKFEAKDAARREAYNQKYEAANKNPEVAKLNEELKKYGYGY